jgi:predicted CopG family antitoxin
MASKTISLETDAYERLKAARLHYESFSQTIRRIVPPPARLARELLSKAKSGKWGKGVEWDRVEKAYTSRRQSPRR